MSAGKAVRMTGTSMDTTRRHELEEQLLHSQRMEATGRLAGGIAHDFNNLLTVIMSYSELGRFALEPSHPSFEALEQINVAAQRAAALTRQLLIFARKEVVDPKVIDLNQLVENVAKLLHRVVGEDVSPDDRSVSGQRARDDRSGPMRTAADELGRQRARRDAVWWLTRVFAPRSKRRPCA